MSYIKHEIVLDYMIEHQIGIEVVERDYTCRHGKFDIVGIGPGGELCFINKRVRYDDDKFVKLSLSDKKRSRFEAIAECYIEDITDYDLLDRPVLFCYAEIKVKGEDRGFFRFSKLD